MAAATLKQVKELLRQLDGSELDDLLKYIKALRQFGSSKTPPAREEEDWLLRGITQVLRKRGLVNSTWWPTKEVRKRAAPHWDENAEQVRRTLLEALPKLDRAQLNTLGTKAAEALAVWLDLRRVQLGPRSMLSNVGNIPEAVDASYPGYMEAGLLKMVLNVG
jgi:hypothetical protein